MAEERVERSRFGHYVAELRQREAGDQRKPKKGAKGINVNAERDEAKEALLQMQISRWGGSSQRRVAKVLTQDVSFKNKGCIKTC